MNYLRTKQVEAHREGTQPGGDSPDRHTCAEAVQSVRLATRLAWTTMARGALSTAACSDREMTTSPSNGRSSVSASVMPGLCQLSKANAASPPGSNRIVFATPLFGIDCGVNWSMQTNPISVTPSGYEFLPPFVAPNSTSTMFQIATGNVQNGPNFLIFYIPIDIFVSTTVTIDDHAETSPYPPGPPEQRVIAYDASHRLLLDTLGGAETVIARRGMTDVTVYPAPENPVPGYTGPDTLRFKRQYSISFRADSSCPPSGDSLIDSKQVRDELRSAMASSLANGSVERGGEIWKMLDGTFRAFPRPNPTATPCSYAPPTTNPPPGAEFGRPSGFYHTHPALPGDIAPLSCGPAMAGGTFQPNSNGGGSDKDWAFANSGMFTPVYAYTKEGRVYRLDPGTIPYPKMKNPNSWKPTGLGCFKK